MLDRQRLGALFQENFEQFGDLGASVSIWQDGAETVRLGGGFQDKEKTIPWTSETPVLIWSATKGPSTACLHHLCERRGIPLSTPVCAIWSEFAAGGKEGITLAEILSHRAGLSALSTAVPVNDYQAVIDALAQQEPEWTQGAGHGYHPRTFGYLLDELVRRITGGTTLGDYWRAQFAEPLGLDLWIGIPPGLEPQVAPIFPPSTSPPKGDPFFTAYLTAGSLTSRAFASPRGLHSASAMNAPEVRTASYPAFGGIGTASALAKFYAMLAEGGSLEGKRYFESGTLAAMETLATQTFDRVLQMETAFSCGFMKDPLSSDGRKLRSLFGPSLRAFGQPGAGGSHAFADPENRISFAYVMNRMEPGVLPNRKSLRLIDAMY